jgi:hypothetical protein
MDMKKAFHYYSLSADQNADAASNLGNLYRNGWGTTVDLAKAFHYWKLAADQGNALSQLNLSAMYARGSGCPLSYPLSAHYLRLASINPKTPVHKKKEAERDVSLFVAQFKGWCLVCNKRGEDVTLKCSKCRSAYYCSVTCQKEAWGRHKAECRKWPV